jgi:murein DD-endopeptidase / murein LD-carboxypeptidase
MIPMILDSILMKHWHPLFNMVVLPADNVNVMRKLLFVTLLGLLMACSAPIKKTYNYPKPLPEKAAKRLVHDATSHVGEPYHFGGTTKKGWDCSGFVRTVYSRSLSIDLPRTANDMFLASLQVPLSHARPGDLVFFKIGHKKASHVGIFIGHEKFIHVSTSDGVIISSLNDPYYKRYLLGMRRISPELMASAKINGLNLKY